MKTILSIILIFLSAPSFAALSDKVLVCRDDKDIYSAYFFDETGYAKQYLLSKIADNFKWFLFNKLLVTSDSNTIKMKMDNLSIYFVLDRKTLIITQPGFNPEYKEICDAYSTKEAEIEMQKLKTQRQKEYNKSLEGNKI